MTDADTRAQLLTAIYGSATAQAVLDRLESMLGRHAGDQRNSLWDQRDVWLITYADQFQRADQAPLQTLEDFYGRRLAGHLNGVHVLPFYPWTSDDGFSVVDFDQIDPRYGTWSDVEALAGSARLMVDGVLNHLSSESTWFKGFLAGDPAYEGFFKTLDPSVDVSSVVRPRTHPLLTRFDSHDGPVHVWTTFSADQVDLDYSNPEVLLRVIEVLLDYARHGAEAIRLDAIGFLWKEPSTTSIHLPQTHAIIQLMRACLDVAYPNVLLISETNVPHAENVSYLGSSGEREAQAVYQFSLPPLVLHAALTGTTRHLTEWARSATEVTEPGKTFFNFLASHDGVGLRPVEGILSDADRDFLVEACRAVGGGVNQRRMSDGSETPYELCTTWFDAMTYGVDEDTALRRHIATHAVMLAMPGIAAIYAQSLVGGSNDRDGAARTGMHRTLNRRRFEADELEREMDRIGSREEKVWSALEAAIEARTRHPAFHPDAAMRVLDLPDGLVGIERESSNGETARCIVNFGNDEVQVDGEGWANADGTPVDQRLAPLDVSWSYRS